MKTSHIKALEVQAQWLAYATWQCGRLSEEGIDVWRMYSEPLAHGDVFYMEPQFSELTDHARRTVPDDLAFEESWMLAERGFMLLGRPFEVPTPIVGQKLSDDIKAVKKDLGIGAVSWFKRHDGGYHFMTHLPYRNGGFGCWSYFTLHDGDKVVERMRKFEDTQAACEETMLSAYPDDTYDKLHEIRWVFTAMHLMSQKLAHTREERTSGMARMDASRKNLRVAPLLRVVSLRRMEEERPAGGMRDVEWQWQWAVRGHWRKQPCGPGRAEHKQVFVEAYIKGPQDRPLKPPQRTLFVAGH